MSPASRRIRADLAFRRIAVVLSGGGGVGAYEVGVFRALEHAGFEPSIVLGVSVGAINALIWVAHGFRSDQLRRVWRRLRPPSVGIRWVTMGARSLGVFLLTLAAFEALLTLADVPELRLGRWVAPSGPELALGWRDMLFDVLAWTLVATVGGALVINSNRFEDALARLTPPADPERIPRLFGWILLALALLFPLSFLFSIPWPRRFHLVSVLFGGLVWLAGNHLRRGGAMRRLVLRTFPETGGRGLWRSAARRRLIDGLLPKQVQDTLFDPHVHLILSACEVESGRLHYFVNWTPKNEFRERVRTLLGDVVEVRTRREMLEAALASSAVPVLFEPVRIHGRQYIDGGVFSNQPIHAVLADGADALLLVLVSPSEMPPRVAQDPHVIDIAARIPQLANWRDLQTELRHLPDGWSREGDPARLCVIEPESGLPGSLLAIDPEITDELLKRGEADAWRGLERAGWIEPDDSPGERDTSEPSTRRESKEASHATRAARAPER